MNAITEKKPAQLASGKAETLSVMLEEKFRKKNEGMSHGRAIVRLSRQRNCNSKLPVFSSDVFLKIPMQRSEKSVHIGLLEEIMESNFPAEAKINSMVDLANASKPEVWESIESDLKDGKKSIECLRKIYSDYILGMESIELEMILKSPKNGERFTEIAGEGAKMAYERVSDIFNSLTIEENMKVVMVGCGQLPVTAIHFAEKTNAGEIVCLDVVESAISSGEILAKKLGLKNIRFRLCSGAAYDYKDSDIVYVANMVRPKTEVIRQIIRTAIKRPQFVVREPYGLGRAWADHCEPHLGKELRVTGYGPGSRYLSRDMYLEWTT